MHSKLEKVDAVTGHSNPQILTSFSSLIEENPAPVIFKLYPPRKELINWVDYGFGSLMLKN